MTLRAWLLAAVAALGCAGGSAQGKDDPQLAAEAAGQKLLTEQLADYMQYARPEMLNPLLADFVARVWVDYTLFAQAAIKGATFTDSATMVRALAFPIRQETIRLWRDSLARRRPRPDPALADSLYAKDSVRVFQHILFSVSGSTPAAEVQQLRRRVETLLEQIARGANFAELARKYSTDASAAEGGYLAPRPRGSFVQPFDGIAWRLGPGEHSGLVVTPFGFHIIRRPPVDEVRDRLLAEVARRLEAKADSAHTDSLITASKLTVAPFAADTIRAIVAGTERPTGSRTVVVSFEGGGLTRADLERELGGLPPEAAGNFAAAADSQLKTLARLLGTTTLLER